jgi:molecular chaperone GrpE
MSQKKHNHDTEVEENSKDQNAEQSQEDSNSSDPSAQVNELNDKYLRLYSDFENFRRRTQKEKIDLIQNANESLLLNLLPVYDDFERALVNMDKSTDPESVKEGVRLIFNKFQKVLHQAGLEEVAAVGSEFDPEFHEAIAKIPADASQKGKIIDQAEKGFKLNDKIIRHAKVVVGE